VTFIPKPQVKKVNKFTPTRPAFRNRQYGSEFNEWELNILKDFSYAKKSTNPSVSGTVVYDGKLGRNRFLLIPAAHLPQDYCICECPDDVKIPANLSYVTVTGQKRVFYDYWEIMIDSIAPAKIRIPIEPDIDFKEFQEQLFLQWGGISSPLRELLAFEFVSSPPMLNFGQSGGLNITIYDATNRNQTSKLLEYFYNIMPPDIALGKSGSLAIPELATEQPLSPFTWRFRSFNADKPLNHNLATFLDRRRSRKFSEVSIGLGSRRKQPKSLYDPPVRLVDQPTILPDEVEMRRMHFEPPLEVTKYIVTMQMLFPTIGNTLEDLNSTLEKAGQKVLDIAEKYDVPQAVRQHGLFDANYYGRPQSMLRLALSSARSQQIQTVDNDLVSKAFEDFYAKNFETIFEAWEDMFTVKGVEMVSLNEADRQILKYIAEKQTNEYGVGYRILSERFENSYSEYDLKSSLQRLRDAGKIREPTYNVYKAIPLE
jgi:hypothetical protein